MKESAAVSVRFSVNIPVYNAEKYIEECVNSVLNQSFTDFEINLVDDGSTDDSEKICRAFADSRIHYYKKANEGPLMTRVYAVSKSQGEYSVFIDCDDYVDSDYLENLDRIISEENCDIVICTYKVVPQNEGKAGGRVWNDKMIFDDENIEDFRKAFLLNANLNSMCTKTIRTRLLKEDRTDFHRFQNVKNGEDLLQSFYPVFNAKKIVFTPESYYSYRKNTASITHSVNIRRYEDIFAVRGEIYNRLEALKMNDSDIEKQYGAVVMPMVIDCIKEIAKAECKTERKIPAFNDVSENEFYKMISSDFNRKSLSSKDKLVYALFSTRKYKTLIKMFSAMGR